MVRLGLIARADDSGLGIQTQRLARFLNPTKVLAIDYSEYKGDHMAPHWERFEAPGRQVRRHKGLLDAAAIDWITQDVDAVLTCEIDYAHGQVYVAARRKAVRSLIQFNYEFLENLRDDTFPMPDIFIAPSTWNTIRLPAKIKSRMVYLPLPLENNWQEEKDPRTFLHVVGKATAEDRNGTRLVFDSLKYTKADFTILVTHQDGLEMPNDSRVKDLGYVPDLNPVYQQAAHLLMPRRFGGQSLVIQEAIASNCTPILLENDPYKIGWRVKSEMKKRIRVYTFIEVYACRTRELARAMEMAIAKPTAHREAMRIYTAEHSFHKLRIMWSEAIAGKHLRPTPHR